MSEATFSTEGDQLARLQLRGGSRPVGVERIEVANFVPTITTRRVVGDVALVTIEGIQRTPRGLYTWCHEIPERFLNNPRALYRALAGPMGATGIVWVGQSGNLARWLKSQLEELAQSA